MASPVWTIGVDDDAIIHYACRVLEQRLNYSGREALGSPEDARRFLSLKLAALESEAFAVMFLDTRHRLIAFDEMFHGTIDEASVYPREVVKAALRHNAAAVIISHNHPSGVPEPSRADEALTARLRDALSLVGVRLLDHVVVGATETVSFAESGLM